MKHGMTKTKFYRVWANMKHRCFKQTNKRYNDYGGRGIIVCNDWLNFSNFKNDMYDAYLEHSEKFGEKNTTIDRIDTNGNYEPDNCRWATYSTQNNNRRPKGKRAVAVSPTGEKFIIYNKTEFAKEHDLDHRHISHCLLGNRKTHKGWKFEYRRF